jgi:glycosyltransferase involved in cell wall biosynthesis
LIPVNQDVLADAIEELICNPEQRQALSARALVQAALAPNLASVTEQYVQLYRQ